MTYTVSSEDVAEMGALGINANVIKKLFYNGYGMEWLRNCTPQELITIDGIAEASARNIFRSLGRVEDWESSGIKVTRRGRGSPIIIAPEGGRPVVDVESDEAALRVDVDAGRERIAEILSQLTDTYEPETTNDISALASLAQDMFVREQLQEFMLGALGEGNQARVGSLGITEEKLSRGIMAKEKHLEIDLATRRELQAARRGDEVIYDLIADTKEFRKDHVRHIQHCGVLLGLVIPHFPTAFPRTMQIICPRCGEIFNAEIVTEKELSLYVEAGDFVPDRSHPSMGMNVVTPRLPDITDEDLLDEAA